MDPIHWRLNGKVMLVLLITLKMWLQSLIYRGLNWIGVGLFGMRISITAMGSGFTGLSQDNVGTKQY